MAAFQDPEWLAFLERQAVRDAQIREAWTKYEATAEPLKEAKKHMKDPKAAPKILEPERHCDPVPDEMLQAAAAAAARLHKEPPVPVQPPRRIDTHDAVAGREATKSFDYSRFDKMDDEEGVDTKPTPTFATEGAASSSAAAREKPLLPESIAEAEAEIAKLELQQKANTDVTAQIASANARLEAIERKSEELNRLMAANAPMEQMTALNKELEDLMILVEKDSGKSLDTLPDLNRIQEMVDNDDE